ncbi:hypothetical protein AZ78_3309 [Lysobacter capsici AZ78]|uniref:Uncharacterized protein n=1 Tax=Lysobacter capsici AZ78 TaxID=1444315 RepID=A0A108UAV4_9GAMM|nr:hypothetical protein AZ78_3309 [Lysobacter capsici AZ78]
MAAGPDAYVSPAGHALSAAAPARQRKNPTHARDDARLTRAASRAILWAWKRRVG